MIRDYRRPRTISEALDLRLREPEAAWLAGGTILLAGDRRAKPGLVLDLGGLLRAGIERRQAEEGLVEFLAGSGASFQDLLDSAATPACLREAALGMANRNVRNQATLGGNIAAGKTCASLLPALLVLEARLRVAVRGSGGEDVERLMSLADWLARPEGIILEVAARLSPRRKAATLRWGRSACDLSVLNAAAGFEPGAGGALRGLRIAFGGAGPVARRFPEIERLLEGRPLPPKEEIEALAAPLLPTVDDHRGSAAFKRLRGAALLADTLHAALAGPSEVGA
jgi:putative selenate reductase FAD-binding subunit